MVGLPRHQGQRALPSAGGAGVTAVEWIGVEFTLAGFARVDFAGTGFDVPDFAFAFGIS
jgi:hypothetical protein